MNTFVSRALFTAAASGTAVLLASGVASAHVTVDAPGAAQGGYTVLTFNVPTESDTAATTQLSVQLPEFKSARPEPLPGWTSTVAQNTDKEATSVTWTVVPGAPGVPPGEFQRFVLSVGPLPNEDQLSFAATQTYSDGKVVEWNQPMGGDGNEPEHPAPTVELAASTGASSDDHHAGTSTDGSAQSASTDTTARWLGGIGLVLGALGAALGLGAFVRGRAK